MSTVFIDRALITYQFYWYTVSHYLGGSHEILSRIGACRRFRLVSAPRFSATESHGSERTGDRLHVGAEFSEAADRGNSRRSCRYRNKLEGTHLRLFPQCKHASVGIRQEWRLHQRDRQRLLRL